MLESITPFAKTLVPLTTVYLSAPFSIPELVPLVVPTLVVLRYNVAVPRVNGDRMDFYNISGIDELKPGFFGIPEPVGDDPIEICDGIVIMPGLAFDSDFGRIGYGGGYYDRFLSENQNVNLKKIALAYEFQMCTPGEIEMEEHDCRPDIIVTDSRIYM